MRTFAVIMLTLVLAASFMGCSKKQESLEDMQQPMSPEDLNRLKTETQQTNATMPTATVVPTTENAQEPLPPSGPYKPSATDIQTALKNANFYTGAVDGKIGPASKRAIEAFQKAHGLTVDGKVGPKTWNALSKYLNAAPASATSQGN